jgi:HEAT repeat protein
MSSRSPREGNVTRVLVAFGLACCVVVPWRMAAAEPKKPVKPAVPAKAPTERETPRAAAPQPVDVEAARRDLASGEVTAAAEAAERLGRSLNPRAAEVLLDALAVGLNPRVAAAALDALVLLKSPRAVPVALHYARNRHPELRKRAVLVFGGFRELRVTQALILRLGDSSREVRALAARLLAERRERAAEEPLLKLLRRGDEAAATALGTVASQHTARQLAELLGVVSDGLLAAALGEYIKRGDVPDPVRVDFVRTLGKMGGAEATAALVEYVGSVPTREERVSKTEAQKLIEQRSQ